MSKLIDMSTASTNFLLCLVLSYLVLSCLIILFLNFCNIMLQIIPNYVILTFRPYPIYILSPSYPLSTICNMTPFSPIYRYVRLLQSIPSYHSLPIHNPSPPYHPSTTCNHVTQLYFRGVTIPLNTCKHSPH